MNIHRPLVHVNARAICIIALMMGAVSSSETTVNFSILQGATTQNTVNFKLAAVRT